MPADALSGPYANQQKMLLYVLPVVFAVGGIAFPIGVLLYWTTSNLWTMCQQFYVIRNNPAPNTEAFRAKEARDAAKSKRKHKHELAEEPGGSAPGVLDGTDVEVAAGAAAQAEPAPAAAEEVPQPAEEATQGRRQPRPPEGRPAVSETQTPSETDQSHARTRPARHRDRWDRGQHR